MEIRKLSRRHSRSSDNPGLGHFTLLSAEDGKDIYKDLQRTCTAIVPQNQPFVWWRSRCHRRRGLLKGGEIRDTKILNLSCNMSKFVA